MDNETWLEKVAFEVSYAWREYVVYRIRMVRNHIKWAYQRLTRGFDDKATWGVGEHLARHTIGVLERFMTLNDGVPHRFMEIAERKVKDEKLVVGDVVQEVGMPLYYAEIGQIVSLLESYVEYCASGEHDKDKYDEAMANVTKAYLMLSRNYHSLWW